MILQGVWDWMNLFCGFVAPGCARPYNLEPVRIIESPLAGLPCLRAVKNSELINSALLGEVQGE